MGMQGWMKPFERAVTMTSLTGSAPPGLSQCRGIVQQQDSAPFRPKSSSTRQMVTLFACSGAGVPRFTRRTRSVAPMLRRAAASLVPGSAQIWLKTFRKLRCENGGAAQRRHRRDYIDGSSSEPPQNHWRLIF